MGLLFWPLNKCTTEGRYCIAKLFSLSCYIIKYIQDKPAAIDERYSFYSYSSMKSAKVNANML